MRKTKCEKKRLSNNEKQFPQTKMTFVQYTRSSKQ